MRLFIDIETLPSLAPGAVDRLREGVRPPANYRKPESIAQWLAENGEAEAQRLWRRQALDGAIGELCAIGVAGDSDEPSCLVRGAEQSEREFLAAALAALDDEREFSGRVLDKLTGGEGRVGVDGQMWPGWTPYFVGHNAAFDLAFIVRRSWVLGVRPPFPLPFAGRHPRDYGDTMLTWTGGRPGEFISLDALCKALGIASPKAAGDGSAVLDWWLAGERDRIAGYCRGDVLAVRECWRRLHWEHAA